VRLEHPPETNIVFVEVPDAAALVRAARQRGVLLGMAGPKRVRALTHLDVGPADVEEAGKRLRDVAAELG
jgi:threonine aldolase